MQSINIKKLAELLQLNVSTVSRALQNNPQISEATKLRVKEAAINFNYIPNANAVNLRNKNTRNFGVLLPFTTNSFYGSFINVLEVLSRTDNYTLQIVQSLDDTTRETEILESFILNRVEGIFACVAPNSENSVLFEKINNLKIPMLFFDKTPPGLNNPRISMNDALAAALAAKIIVKKDKKKVLAILGNPNLSITQKREQALKTELNKYKDIAILPAHCDSLQAACATFITEYKKHQPDVVFCMSDEILQGVMRGVMELGINYPTQMGIIAMSEGDIPKHYYPEITFIETNGKKLATACYAAMKKLLANETVELDTLVPSVLVELGSL
jgi:LacI family transcriptional regulator